MNTRFLYTLFFEQAECSFLCWKILHCYALPGVGNVVSAEAVVRDHDTPYETVENLDALGAVFAGSLRFIHDDMVDQLARTVTALSVYPTLHLIFVGQTHKPFVRDLAAGIILIELFIGRSEVSVFLKVVPAPESHRSVALLLSLQSLILFSRSFTFPAIKKAGYITTPKPAGILSLSLKFNDADMQLASFD